MFTHLQSAVSARFDSMAKDDLFVVEFDQDEIWQVYLNSFPVETRQSYNCSCCRHFIRTIGPVVTIDKNLDIQSVWNLNDVLRSTELFAEYGVALDRLRHYVLSKAITGRFIHFERSAGVKKNLDKVRNIFWDHFHVAIPDKHFAVGPNIAPLKGTFSTKKQVLSRVLKEIPISVTETLLELIAQNRLYRGATYKTQLDGLLKVQKEYEKTPEDRKEVFGWKKAGIVHDSVAGIRNSAIGTLMVDLAEGRDINQALTAYERVVAPTNYQRPTATVTPRMIEDAKVQLQDLGFISALGRRQLDSRDLTAADALYVYRPTTSQKDVFAELAGDVPVNPQSLTKVEEISIEKFIEKVLPTAKSVRVLLENRHQPNFVSLTGPTDPDAKSLFSWDNSFGWSYTGGVADSIKERVKAAGGRTDGWMRISLAWHNHDDLDLHFTAKNNLHVYYANKLDHSTGVHLDVDMNAGFGRTREPVENLYFPKALPAGNYSFYVNQFHPREKSKVGYTIQIEQGGRTLEFSKEASPQAGGSHPVAFTVTKDGQVEFKSKDLSETGASKVKWGLKTNTWHEVTSLTLSPNHWTKKAGNKHFMFILKGCTSDEKIRPFYNEFLCSELSKHRKVTEVLADKIDVIPADGAELSGLGFSESIRNHIFVEVTGAFKSTLKITF